MLSLSPTLAKRCADALETVARAPLSPIVDRETPRNLAIVPPSVRSLPADLQIAILADMLADMREMRDDRNEYIQELRKRLAFSEQACGRALRELAHDFNKSKPFPASIYKTLAGFISAGFNFVQYITI